MKSTTKKKPQPTATLRKLELPRIGEYWPGQGGRFMGILLDDDGGSEYALIKAEKEAAKVTHAGALAFAQTMKADGHSDFDAPSPHEGRLLFVNGDGLFKKEWYWLKPRSADDSSYAWSQSFYGGYQNDYPMGHELRGCAVRRLKI